jgi:hypothetical protein
MVSMTGFVTCARVQRKPEEGVANEGVQWIRQQADTMNQTHSSIYRIYLYVEGYSHTWLVSSAMVAL